MDLFDLFDFDLFDNDEVHHPNGMLNQHLGFNAPMPMNSNFNTFGGGNMQAPALFPSFIDDPNGGVIVRDIFGGEHHYSNMLEAQTLSDFFSGFPIHSSNNVSDGLSFTGDNGGGHLPTDIHTETDLTFYNNKISDAQKKLDKAMEDALHSNDPNKIEDAMNRQRQAKHDIDYWNGIRSRESYNQTMQNLKHDNIINNINKSINDFHDVMNKK